MKDSLDNRIRDRLDAALKKAMQLGAAGAKISCRRAESLQAQFEAGRLKDTGGSQTFAYFVDLLVNGRRGQSGGNNLDDLDTLVERAVTLAAIGSVAHFDTWPAPARFTPVKKHSPDTLALSRERMIAACGEMVDLLKAHDPDLFITAQAGRSEREGILMTTSGVAHQSASTTWSLGAGVQQTRGTDILLAGDGRSWCQLNSYFDANAIAQKTIGYLKHAEREADPPTGRTRVFLPPEGLGMFLWPLTLAINGRAVAKGESPLAGKIGQPVLAPCFTITDDPHRDYCPGASELDNDGIPTRRQALVEKGILQRFLYDLDSAGLAKTEPTGNCGCHPYYPVLETGTRTSAELLKNIKDGLYLTDNLIGFGQSNILNGDFSCNVGLGYRIRNGEIVGRVKNTMIAGNLFEILRQDVELSSDTDYEGSTPYAVVDGVSVSAHKR